MQRIVKVICSVIDFFLFSNIYIAFATAALTIETLVLLNIPDFKFVLFVFFSTLFLYSFHRIFRLNKRGEKEQREKRHSWVKQNTFLFYSVFFIAFIALCYSVIFYLDFKTVLFLFPVAVLSFGYSIPFIQLSGGLMRLRDLPGLKIFLISFTLSYVTVILPVIHHFGTLQISTGSIFFVFFRRMLFVFAITIPFDIRDMEYDSENNVKTLPIIFGVEKAKSIAVFALMVFGVLVFIQYILGMNMNPIQALALLVSLVFSALVILRTNTSRKEYFYTLGVEGMLLLQALLIFLSAYTNLPSSLLK